MVREVIAGAARLMLLIAAVAPLATAQNAITPRGAERDSSCLPRASRATESCDPSQDVVGSEKETTFRLELPPTETAQCAATIELAYTQRGAMVSVEGVAFQSDAYRTLSSEGENRLNHRHPAGQA